MPKQIDSFKALHVFAPLTIETGAVIGLIGLAAWMLAPTGKTPDDDSRKTEVAYDQVVASELAPVRAFATLMAGHGGEAYVVLTVPAGSISYQQGKRFVAVPKKDVDSVLAMGAASVSD